MIKCDQCGYSDKGTGDWAHVCGPINIKTIETPEEFDRFEEFMANEIMVTVADKLDTKKDESHLPVSEQSLVFRLRKRAEIRRQIPGRLAVTEGKPDKIANLLDEAANEIDILNKRIKDLERHIDDWK
jgi:hypothetical protein